MEREQRHSLFDINIHLYTTPQEKYSTRSLELELRGQLLEQRLSSHAGSLHRGLQLCTADAALRRTLFFIVCAKVEKECE